MNVVHLWGPFVQMFFKDVFLRSCSDLGGDFNDLHVQFLALEGCRVLGSGTLLPKDTYQPSYRLRPWPRPSSGGHSENPVLGFRRRIQGSFRQKKWKKSQSSAASNNWWNRQWSRLGSRSEYKRAFRRLYARFSSQLQQIITSARGSQQRNRPNVGGHIFSFNS